ncbi:MAG: bifunctional phosphopantothenoylcysteine decarboxylase/phosphopantothenate--cysteine ligase CoaBC [FCB group bacterium]|nr:bifunctional phosphopantothenoylcysteine decarboxylase/phosphopantothenate--cysteine ligase CoaBC [FCB group bacterium]
MKDKKVLVGLTGGIACYKIPYLIRMLRKNGAEVRVVMTEGATKFITPLTLETVSDNPVAVEMFPEAKYIATRHIDWAQWPDLVFIAPATANFLGKVASGVSDDLLTTIICATPRPVMIAPAMNPQMWSNKITQRNYTTLKKLGYVFIEPDKGEMACEDYGVGRMVEPQQLFEKIKVFFQRNSKKKVLKGKKVLITAGPTREIIDPVRYISNFSSGKMGYALAEAALRLGAETTLISGPSDLIPPYGVKFEKVTSTEDLYKAVKKEFSKTDCLIMAAAPVDYTPVRKVNQKIKKTEKTMQLSLKPTVDILKRISRYKKENQIIVGFALETQNGLSNARRKLKDKHLNMIVLNQPSAETGFESDTNKVTIITSQQKKISLPLMSKEDISYRLLDHISRML